MLPKSQTAHASEFGVKKFVNTLETGLKIYGVARGVYQAGSTLLQAGRTIAPMIAGML